MCVHASTPEGDVFAEFAFQFHGIHVGGIRLHGVETIHAGVDEIGKEGNNAAVRVIENGRVAVIMNRGKGGFVTGQHELAIVVQLSA